MPSTIAPIHAAELSTPDARRSPAVDLVTFQRYARRGLRDLGARRTHSQPVADLSRAAAQVHAATLAPWGGVTLDAATGAELRPSAGYALTVRPSGHSPVVLYPGVGVRMMGRGLARAVEQWADVLGMRGAALGAFHDADLGEIHLDPVVIVDTLEQVHTLGAATRALGGAYCFADGLGYWPPHVRTGA